MHTFTHTGRGARLSPDGSRLAYTVGGGPAAVQALDGSTVTLPAGFTPTGWLDDGLVVGTTGGGELAYVALTAPRRSVDIGFPGTFVGALRGRAEVPRTQESGRSPRTGRPPPAAGV